MQRSFLGSFSHHPVDLQASRVALKRSRSMRNDPELNIRLVEHVQEYPILYNYFLDGYSNKQEVEKIWNEIGSNFNVSGIACRERWMTLRGNYSRALKSFRSENPPKRDYYLARHMQFLIPYMKIRQQNISGNNNIKVENLSEVLSNVDGDHQFEEDKEERGLVIDDDSSKHSQFNNKSTNILKRKNKMNRPIESKGKLCEDNPDLSFFKSLLPEMALLNPPQKTNFKILMLKSLNGLLYSSSDVN